MLRSSKGLLGLAILSIVLGIVAFVVTSQTTPKQQTPVGVAGAVFLVLGLGLLFLVFPQRDHSQREPMLRIVRANFKKLDPKFGKIPLYSGDGAYTDNKSVITLCLTNPETGEKYDINTIMYVALHELAHVISKGIGHGEEFMQNFTMVREKAEMLGFYDPHKEIPTTYCGTQN